MLLNHSGSYYEDYKRSKSVKSSVSTDASNERLLTDRSAYISFLEVQLERVSAACLTSQGFSERIEQVHAEVIALREKSNNISKTVTSTQGFCDAQSEQSSQHLNEINQKIKVMSAEVAECMNEISSARLAMAHVKKIPDEIQAKRKEDIDNLKHRLENTFTAAIGDRIDVMQARVHATEAKVKDMDTIAKAETQSALDSIESKLRIAIDTVNEQAAARSRSVETKLSADMQRLREDFDERMTKLENIVTRSLHGKPEGGKGTAQTEKLRRENRLLRKELDLLHKDMKDEISSVDSSCKALLGNVRQDLREEKEALLVELKKEVKVHVSKLLRSEAEPTNLPIQHAESSNITKASTRPQKNGKGVKAMSITSVQADVEAKVDDCVNSGSRIGLTAEPDVMKGESSSNAAETVERRPKLDAALEQYLDGKLERLLSSSVAGTSVPLHEASTKLTPALDAVNNTLEEQSVSVAESMKKIEEFMKVYSRTQKDLKASLKKGKQHQHNLHSLVERANTGIREAASRIDLDETNSEEEDCCRSERRLRRKPRSVMRRTRSSVRSKSADSFGQEHRSGRRTGGGKRGRGSVEFPDDEIFGAHDDDVNAKYLVSQLRSSERTPSSQRPPWNSCSKYPSKTDTKQTKESKGFIRTVKKTRKGSRKSRTKSSLLKDFEKLEKSRNMLQKLYHEMDDLK